MDNLNSFCPECEKYVSQMAEVAALLWEKGWAERNAGNLSVDVTRHFAGLDNFSSDGEMISLPYSYPTLANRWFLVTGTGQRFRDCAKCVESNACLLRLNNAGDGFQIVWGGANRPDFRPTSEFPAHLRVHEHLVEQGSKNFVVLHTHPSDLIALTHFPEYQTEGPLNDALLKIHPEVKFNLPTGVGFIPYKLPGSEKLALATVDGFKRGYQVVLWEMHGVVTVADDVVVAFDLIDTVNKAAMLILKCRAAGLVPKGMSDENLEEIDELLKTMK